MAARAVSGLNGRTEAVDVVLNDFNPEWSPVSLCTQLFYKNRPEDVIFLLGVSHRTG